MQHHKYYKNAKRHLSNKCIDVFYLVIAQTYEEILVEAKLTVNSKIDLDYIENYIIYWRLLIN